MLVPSSVGDHETDIRGLYLFPIGATKIVDGEGIYARDADGNEFIDCASGTFNLSLGYRHPTTVQAIRDNADRLLHVTSSFQTDPVNGLVERLVEVSPANLCRVHVKVSGGSTANEGAIKMAMRRTGSRDVISLFRSHHGQTLATTAISGNAFRREPFPDVPISRLIVPDPYCRRCFYGQKPDSCGTMCVDRIDDFIEFAGSGTTACVMVEPISGNGGNVVPPEGYLQRLQAFCGDRSIPLIFDEIQTGIGRTGSMFAAQHFGVEPDIITTGKGLGGGAQVAAILTTDAFDEMETHNLSFTYGANVLAAAVACATLDEISRPGFLDNVKATGHHLLGRLQDLATRHRQVDDVRGVGLMIGFEMVDEAGGCDAALANEIVRKGPQYGLLLRSSQYGRGNVIKIRPPLTLTLDEADLICDRLDQLFQSTLS